MATNEKNNYKKALNDPEIKELYKDKPFHVAVLHALSSFKDKGGSLLDLPWFPFHKKNGTKKIGVVKKD